LKAQLNPNKIRNLTQNNHIVNHHQITLSSDKFWV
jgi:hypothetical protein